MRRDYADWATTNMPSDIAWLNDFRATRRAQFTGFPTAKNEHFRFNDLTCLQQIPEQTAITATPETIDARVARKIFSDSTWLVFVDGELDVTRSTCTTYTLLANATPEQQAAVLARLNQSDFKRNPFASSICANIGNGIVIDASALDKPLEIIHVQTHQHDNTFALICHLGSNDNAVILERFVNLSDTDVLQQVHTVIDIAENATLTHYRFNTANNMYLGQIDYLLSRDSKLDTFHHDFGSKLKRVDINVHHRGSGSHAQLNGTYYANENQQVDYHTTIEHAVPHCETDEVFRGILDGEAVGVFNGRIHIHRDAQKTRAELSNKNLLLNAGARIHTKPELEIYADDVVCAHGATISRPNNDELFYLLARGIPRRQAELMLTVAFVNELIDSIKHDDVAAVYRPLLEAKLTEPLGVSGILDHAT